MTVVVNYCHYWQYWSLWSPSSQQQQLRQEGQQGKEWQVKSLLLLLEIGGNAARRGLSVCGAELLASSRILRAFTLSAEAYLGAAGSLAKLE